MIHVLAFGIKPVFFLAMYFCGVGYFVRFLKNLVLHNPVSILYCHRVIDSTQPQYEFLKASGHLTVENFEKRIAYLSRRFTFISPKDFALYKIDPRRPKNLVMLTFDDGYKCFFTNVFPLLKKYNIHALLFLAVDSIEQRTLLWYDEVIYLVNLSREEGFRIPQLSIRYFRLTTMQDKLESCGYILEELKKMSPACRNAIIGSLYATLGVTKKDIDSLEIMLKWPEIKEMLDSGLVTIGSHTSSHPILTTVSTEQLTHEIVDSKRMLESKLGVVVNCFAYPNGRLIDFNQQAIDLLKISGYKFAFTTTEFQPDDNNFSIARYGMIDEPFMRFVLRICGLFEIRSMIFRRSRIAWLYKVGSVKYDTMLVHPKVNAWMLNYVGSSGKRIARSIAGMARPPKHVFLCVCDHFEPLRDHSSYSSGLKRVSKWVEAFPAIAKRYCDADGCCPKYTFFYPEEEYRKEYLDLLAGLKQSGLAEVEVHLHHDNDTDPHLRRMLLDYKNLLHEHHGLLSVDKKQVWSHMGLSTGTGHWIIRAIGGNCAELTTRSIYSVKLVVMPISPCPPRRIIRKLSRSTVYIMPRMILRGQNLIIGDGMPKLTGAETVF